MAKKKNPAVDAIKNAVKTEVENKIIEKVSPKLDGVEAKDKDQVKADLEEAALRAAGVVLVGGDKDAAKEEVKTAVKAGVMSLLKNALLNLFKRK